MASSNADSLNVAQLRNTLQPLSFSDTSTYSRPILDYFAYYGLNQPHCTHYFGTFPSGRYTLAAHIYKPDSSRGTVFLVHGYYDHAGILKNLIRACLEENFCVALCDLPGHGLSSGEPAAIDSFSEYSAAVGDFLAKCDGHVRRPYATIGHSTGCAALLSRLFFSDEHRFSRVILLAPLVRSEYWTLSKAGYFCAPFAKTLPRWMRNESHDATFVEWFNRDPLQVKVFPVRWATAFYSWEARIDTVTPRALPVSVIQGTGDNTVDWRYNLPFLQKKILGCATTCIPDARHQLANETEPYREKCLKEIRELLRKL